ncbi:MAG: polyphosphate kinase 1 [Pseudobdellovibrionaceae bacterium]
MNGTKPSSSKKVTSRKRGNRKLKVIEHPLSSEKLFTNREIGWLRFNRRVLSEAEDIRNPLLERLRFLSISSSNMDEFFMKRVGGLKRQVVYGISPKSADGQTPAQQLASIRQVVLPTIQEQDRCFEKVLKPALAEKGIFLLKWADLTVKEKELVKKYYHKNVFPVLTPLSVDPGHPFPFISNLSTSLGVTLKHPERDEKLFARVKIPKVLPQWIRANPEAASYRFVSLVEVIRENLGELFPSMQVVGAMAFRLTRNADAEHDQEDTEDLLEMIEEELRQRRFAEVVRLEHGPNPDPWMIQFLMEELELSEEYIYELRGELDYTDLNMIHELNLPKLKYEAWTPVVSPALAVEDANSFFAAIKQQDHLLHHPYESFSSTVEKFIRLASTDPKVLAIKMTLYRTGDNSPFIKSLIRAAEAGKQVVCLVELKARFDEERNIYWAQELENAGVHVVYGVVGLKTHAKTALVVRQEVEGLHCYCHIGTGNYNVTTSRFYTDLGLLTAREEITKEIVEFFHYLTGRSLKSSYENLLIAPVNMFPRFKSMIEREGEHAKAGRPAQIIAKFNNMEENDIAMSLYEASQKGAEIDLIVRGFCCLRPKVPGLSERLRVTSVIGRFLEHSRIFYFRNGAQDPLDGIFYIGSADWMYRNLHARVEAIVPIIDRVLKEKIWEILQLTLKDQRQTWQMTSEGEYTQRKSNEPGVQQVLMQLAKQRVKNMEENNSSGEP